MNLDHNSPDLMAAAMAIHAQRRKVFTLGPGPYDPTLEVKHGGQTWSVRFSAHMPVDKVVAIVERLRAVSTAPGATPEMTAVALAWMQAADITVANEMGGGS